MKKNAKILVVTSKYHADTSNPYLTNDLVEGLSEYAEKIIVVGYGEASKTACRNNIEEHVLNLQLNIKFLKYFLIWPLLLFKVARVLIKEKEIDQIIMFAPLVVLWPAAFLLRFTKIKRKTAIVFDLFPIHQVQIGSIPKFCHSLAKVFERYLLSGFNRITAMGSNNKRWIENYYGTSSFEAEVVIAPLWRKAVASQLKASHYDGPLKLIFGGQIIKGRELDTMVEHLTVLKDNGLDITLDIYSQGQGFETLKSEYDELSWISFNNQIPRVKYMEVLSDYDVGLIVTDRRVTLPTFPSKILDYSAAGVASYCLVESETDLCDIFGDGSIIHLNFFNFSVEEIAKSIGFFYQLKQMSECEREAKFNAINEYLSIDSTILKLLK